MHQVICMDAYSRIIAKYVVNLKYDDLPEEVIEKTKMHFLDYLGNALAETEFIQAVNRLEQFEDVAQLSSLI